jgi:3-carboxy-cis,cis-muconate cycloisomerase
MRANLDLTKGGIMAEALMIAAAPALGRDRAHDELMRLTRAAAASGEALADDATRDEMLGAALGADGIAKALPTRYLGESARIADDVARAER